MRGELGYLYDMHLEEIEDVLHVLFPIEQSSNKEVYLIVKKQLTFEDLSCSCEKLGFVQHISFKLSLQVPYSIKYVS